MSVQLGDGSATVTWDGSDNLSETPVTYEITVSPAPGSGASDSTQETSYRVTGMENGVSYTITLTPTNDRGAGPATSRPVVPGRGPEVTSASAERTGDRTFRVSYAIDDGGRSVTDCTVAISGGGGSVGCDPSSGSVSVDVPQFNTGYTFTVTVTTELGDGDRSAEGTSNGKALTVDGSAQRWDGACTWNTSIGGRHNARPYYANPAHQCPNDPGGPIGWVASGNTVRGLCWTTGGQIQDDNLVQSNRWIRVDAGGYMSTLYFTNYNSNPESNLPRC
jgi:hypothetical protein